MVGQVRINVETSETLPRTVPGLLQHKQNIYNCNDSTRALYDAKAHRSFPDETRAILWFVQGPY